MPCHFQLSLSKADELQAKDPSSDTYTARLRRDGEVWRKEPIHDEQGATVGTLCSPHPVEDIRKFPLWGPPGLLEDTTLAQIGWCLSQVEILGRELSHMQPNDRLSFNGVELPGQNWNTLIKKAVKVSASLAQREILDAQTPTVAPTTHRPRF